MWCVCCFFFFLGGVPLKKEHTHMHTWTLCGVGHQTLKASNLGCWGSIVELVLDGEGKPNTKRRQIQEGQC